MQWTPAYYGIKGNEEADQPSKNGAADTQPKVNLTFHEKKTIIKSTFKGVNQKDDYHLLNREDQVILFRLRTGHNRLNHHMNKKFKLVLVSVMRELKSSKLLIISLTSTITMVFVIMVYVLFFSRYLGTDKHTFL